MLDRRSEDLPRLLQVSPGARLPSDLVSIPVRCSGSAALSASLASPRKQMMCLDERIAAAEGRTTQSRRQLPVHKLDESCLSPQAC